jgi:hypothetical protein
VHDFASPLKAKEMLSANAPKLSEVFQFMRRLGVISREAAVPAVVQGAAGMGHAYSHFAVTCPPSPSAS